MRGVCSWRRGASFHLLAGDAQSPHRAHHRDLVPGVAASWRLDAAVSQRLSNCAKGLAPHRFEDRPEIGITGRCGFGDHLAEARIAENDTALLGLGQRIARAFRDQRTLFLREGRMSASVMANKKTSARVELYRF